MDRPDKKTLQIQDNTSGVASTTSFSAVIWARSMLQQNKKKCALQDAPFMSGYPNTIVYIQSVKSLISQE
jgi:hypothetical protein